MTRAQMEARRLGAIPDIEAWENPGQLARALNVSRTTLYRWKQARAAGQDLKRRRPPGRRPKMTPAQTQQAIELFYRGPRTGAVKWTPSAVKWTQKRFAQAIKQEIGIAFDHDHCGRIMHKLGLTQLRKRKPC